MGARAGLGINDSVPNGSIGTENTIPAPTEIDFGDEVIRGFLFDNILHSENDGDIHFGLYIPGSYDGSEPFALFVTLPGYNNQAAMASSAGENHLNGETGYDGEKSSCSDFGSSIDTMQLFFFLCQNRYI